MSLNEVKTSTSNSKNQTILMVDTQDKKENTKAKEKGKETNSLPVLHSANETK